VSDIFTISRLPRLLYFTFLQLAAHVSPIIQKVTNKWAHQQAYDSKDSMPTTF